MRLISCHVENFGKLSNVDIDFTDGVNEILKDNGWGKTSLTRFILSMFYGLEGTGKKKLEENDRKRFQPWNDGYFGGELTFELDEKAGKRYIIVRNFGKKDKEAEFKVLDATTRLETSDFSEKIGEELFGVNRESFLKTAFVGSSDIKYQGSNSVINAKLGSVSQKDDLENYDKAKAELKDYLNANSPKRTTGEISKMKNRIAELEKEIATAPDLEGRLQAVRANRDNEEKKMTELEKKNSDLNEAVRLRTEIDSLENSKNLIPSTDSSKMDRLAKTFENGIPEEKEFEEQIAVCNEMQGLIQKNDTLETLIETLEDNIAASSVDSNVDATVQQQREKLIAKRKQNIAFGIVSIIIGLAIAVGLSLIHPSTTALSVAAGTVLFIEGIIMLYKNLSEKVVYTGGTGAKQSSVNDRPNIERYRQNIKSNNDTIKTYEAQLKEFLARFGASYSRIDVEQLLYDLKAKAREYKEALDNKDIHEKEMKDFRDQLEEKKKNWEEYLKLHPELGSTGNAGDILESQKTVMSGMNEVRQLVASYDQESQDLIERIDELEEKKGALLDLKEECEELSAKYRIVELTDKYLGSAKDSFVSTYMSPLKTAFEKYYEIMTGDKGDFHIDANLSITYKDEGSYHDIVSESDGNGDMIGLSARMAFLDVMYEKEKPVIIMDDPFVHLDEKNLAGAKRFLEVVAKDYQVIYLTCRLGK